MGCPEEAKTKPCMALARNLQPFVHLRLAALLEEAKAFDVCYDADEELGEDPFCMTEDLGEDPRSI